MKLIIKKGTTSKLQRIFVTDSSKTDGSGLTGLVHNTANLTAYYIREGAASATAITLVTATVGTFTSSGFKEVDATNMPGVYELHPPNAVLASGADSVLIFMQGAANMAPLPIEIQLDDNTSKDIYDALVKVKTTVSISNHASSFTITGGAAIYSAYRGMTMSITDASDGHDEVRRIKSYSSGRVVVLDRALGFTPAVADIVEIMSGFADVNLLAVKDSDGTASNFGDDYNGTGYAKANSTIGTCTTNTDMRGTDNAALAATALTNVTWTDAKAGFIDVAISGRAPANEYDTQMGYIPSNLADVPTATELIAAHGAGSWVDSGVSPTAVENAIAVWDRILTGATHNIPTSAGRRVREIGAFAIHSGTAQAGDSHSITLAATASPSDVAYNGIYNRNLIVLTDNTGVGQTRTIVDYDAVTKVVVVDRDWRISPDATTTYQVVPDDTPLTVDHGVARGGTNRTITIRAYASSVDDAYLCNIVTIIAGKGRGQARLVGAYDGTTNIVTICGDDWVDTPDTTSVYVMMPYGVACAACIGDFALDQMGDAVWDEDLTGHTTSKSAGWFVQKIKAIVDTILGLIA